MDKKLRIVLWSLLSLFLVAVSTLVLYYPVKRKTRKYVVANRPEERTYISLK